MRRRMMVGAMGWGVGDCAGWLERLLRCGPGIAAAHRLALPADSGRDADSLQNGGQSAACGAQLQSFTLAPGKRHRIQGIEEGLLLLHESLGCAHAARGGG